MSAFIDGDRHCVDMETYEPVHRQRYGLAAASAFRRACAERDLTMHWSCMEENVASYELAQRLGLQQVGKFSCYSFQYPEPPP